MKGVGAALAAAVYAAYAAVVAAIRRARQPAKPSPADPRNFSAHVDGSGTGEPEPKSEGASS